MDKISSIKNTYTRTSLVIIPIKILCKKQLILLSGNIMLMNKIRFFITALRYKKFNTAEHIVYCKYQPRNTARIDCRSAQHVQNTCFQSGIHSDGCTISSIRKI